MTDIQTPQQAERLRIGYEKMLLLAGKVSKARNDLKDYPRSQNYKYRLDCAITELLAHAKREQQLLKTTELNF